jgi:hypothetical protein
MSLADTSLRNFQSKMTVTQCIRFISVFNLYEFNYTRSSHTHTKIEMKFLHIQTHSLTGRIYEVNHCVEPGCYDVCTKFHTKIVQAFKS